MPRTSAGIAEITMSCKLQSQNIVSVVKFWTCSEFHNWQQTFWVFCAVEL